MKAAAAEHNGLPIEAHLGRAVAEVVPELWPRVEAFYRQVLAEGRPLANIEVTGETLTGTSSWIESFYRVVVGGAVVNIGVILLDVSKRRRLETASEHRTDAASTPGAVAHARDLYAAGHER